MEQAQRAGRYPSLPAVFSALSLALALFLPHAPYLSLPPSHRFTSPAPLSSPPPYVPVAWTRAPYPRRAPVSHPRPACVPAAWASAPFLHRHLAVAHALCLWPRRCRPSFPASRRVCVSSFGPCPSLHTCASASTLQAPHHRVESAVTVHYKARLRVVRRQHATLYPAPFE